MKKLLLAAAVLSTPATSLYAGVISRACIQSERPATPALCRCIQQAADLTLGSRDQNRAAGFFHDPHKAQEVRVSDSRQDNAFWDRYQNFGQTAKAMCGN